MLAVVSPILLFAAFLLLLLVSLSVPIIKTISLFNLVATVSDSALDSNANGSVTFGVWGYCVSAINVEVVGVKHTDAAQCSKVHLGYTFDSTVAKALNVQGFENVLSRTTTAALVLHPVACGLTFLALLMSLFMWRRRHEGTSRAASLFTFGFGILAAAITTLIFLIDVILIGVVKSKVHHDTKGEVNLNWGNAVWLVLAAAIAIWISLLGACTGICGCCGRRNRKY